MSQFSAIEQDALRRMARAPEAVGLDIVEVLDTLYDGIDGLTSGSTAMGADIDSLCLGGGAFTINPDTTTGLTLGYNAGRIHGGMNEIVVAAGTILLAASATNYIEVDSTGTVWTNTSAFTTGRMPLYTVVTGSTSIPDNAWTSYKALLTVLGPASIPGVMLTAPGQTKELCAALGTIEAGFGAVPFVLICPYTAATIEQVVFSTGTAVAQSDANYWSFSLVDLGSTGTGSDNLLDTGADNTTKATGGSALQVGKARSLVLSGGLATAANDVLVFTLTPTGAPPNLNLCSVRVDLVFTT